MRLLDRIATAILHAMGAFVIAGVVSCMGLMALVSNSHDGQAGMGAAFGGFYIACLAAIITLVVSLKRSSPFRRARSADGEPD
jgi:membrane associated rhomboid family serine protease